MDEDLDEDDLQINSVPKLKLMNQKDFRAWFLGE